MDASAVRRVAAAARTELGNFARQSYEAVLGADVSAVRRAVAAARTELLRFAGENYEVTLDADASAIRRVVAAARTELGNFARQSYEAVLGADTSDVRTDVSAAERLAEGFDRQTFIAALGVSGGAEAAAELKAVEAEADRLDRRDVNVDVNADESGIRSLSSSFKGLASNIRATGTVLAAAAIPFAIAAIGGGVSSVAALAASVGGLSVALGQGLVGASVAAAGALGTLEGAILLVTAPIKLLLGTLKDYDASLDTVKSAQASAESAATSYASAQDQLATAEQNLNRARSDGVRAIKEQQRAVGQARKEGAASIAEAEQSLAEARRTGTQEIEDAEQSLRDTRQESARSIAEQERSLADTRRSVSQANAAAESELESARDTLASATRSLTAAQEELNRAQRDEPLSQLQATYDLADARDRASDAERDYDKAVEESGRHSEEATDALRAMRQANLDLEVTERAVRDTRRQGSDELVSAKDAVKSAYEEQRSAAEGVRTSERSLQQTRAEGVRQIEDQQRALRQARTDAQRSIAEEQQALQRARADAARQEAEEQRALIAVRAEAASQVADEQRALAETRRTTSRQIADANAQVASAQQAATLALKALREAQQGVSEETVKLTKAQKALYDEYQRFKKLGDTAFLPAQNAAARLGVEVLRLAESYLPRLGRASTQTINALSDVFTHFRQELARPVEQAGITRYLQLIPRFTREAGKAAVDLGLALFNVFTRSLKYVLPLTRGIGDLTSRFLAFTHSASGRNAIDTFFANAIKRALALKGVVLNLGRGLFNLFDAINRTGLTNQAFSGLQAIASGFERITRRGTESRHTLNRFLNDARSLMPFVGRAVLGLVKQIGQIAGAVISARQQGHKLTVLQEIFRGIGRAAKPLRNLLVGTFTDLGPEIAKLIPRLARFFSVFAGSSGPLVTFVRVINRALQIFNNLPGPVKRTVVNLAALKLILGGLGVGAVVGPMGRFASNMVIARGAAAKLAGKSALLGVVGGLARMSLLLAGGIGLAALAGGLYLVYRRNKLVHEAVDRLASRLKNNLRPEINKAQEAWQNFGKGVASRIDKLGDMIVSAFDLKRKNREAKIRSYGKASANRFMEANMGTIRARAASMDNDGAPGFEVGQKIGLQIGTGIHNWLSDKGKSKNGLADIGAAKWVQFITPAGIATYVASWVGKTFTGGILKGIDKKVSWGDIASLIIRLFQRAFPFVALGNWIADQSIKHIFKPIKNALGNAHWGELGKDAALGIVKGFIHYDIAKAIIEKISNVLDSVKKDNKGNSPWGSTRLLGRDAAQGFALGLLEDGGAVEKNARKLAGRAGKAIRDGVVSLGDVPRTVWNQLLERGWKGNPKDSAERLYRPQMGMATRHPDTPYWNNRTDPNRGKPGYVRAEDGSWVKKSFYDTPRHMAARHPDTPYWNSRTDPNRGKPGYVRTEDGSWVKKSFYDTSPHRGSGRNYGMGGALSDGTVNFGEISRKRWERLISRGWQGRATDHMNRLYSPAQNRTLTDFAAARRPDSPGGRGITKDEMRDIMHEVSDKQLKNMQAIAAMTGASPEFARFLDAMMSKDFSHRTNMGANPV